MIQKAELLAQAWQLPVAMKFNPLLSQSFTSICGPTSVANILRSMGVKAGKNPLRGLGLRPMSLDQVVSESYAVVPAGWTVTAVRPRTVDELREELRSVNDPKRRYVSNFHRGAIFGRGGGHHSPLGGYLEREDLAFVLDVNPGYGPWLVPTATLFEAMRVNDRARRGLARFDQANSPPFWP